MPVVGCGAVDLPFLTKYLHGKLIHHFIKADYIPSVLDPIKFGQKWDPKGKFIRKYCPELKNMPIRYLFAPWKAPRSIQEEAKCIVGTDYPTPIVDHRQARAHNAELIREMNNLSLQEVEGEA